MTIQKQLSDFFKAEAVMITKLKELEPKLSAEQRKCLLVGAVPSDIKELSDEQQQTYLYFLV